MLFRSELARPRFFLTFMRRRCRRLVPALALTVAVAGVLIQYPLYAGIVKIMTESGLASRFAQAAILEYDTLVWDLDSLTETNAVFCSRIFDNGDSQFTAKTYGHSPWIATQDTWWRILQAGDDIQGGWPDRWLSLAAERANIKLKSLRSSFSCDWGWSEKMIQEAIDARAGGAQAIHGMKSEAITKLLLEAQAACAK
mgnify:CR=1 FL=1